MGTVTGNDLKELKDLITQLSDRMNDRFNKVEEKLNDMKVEIATLKEGQNAIQTRLDDTNKRIDNVDFINRSIFVAPFPLYN